ncbi:hypothetical protein KI387_010187, partial [Taxus chinensis]
NDSSELGMAFDFGDYGKASVLSIYRSSTIFLVIWVVVKSTFYGALDDGL